MNKDKALKVIQLAKEMLEKAEQYIEAFDEDAEATTKWLNDRVYYGKRKNSLVKTSGALRRSSLDLTRALAEMRKPG